MYRWRIFLYRVANIAIIIGVNAAYMIKQVLFMLIYMIAVALVIMAAIEIGAQWFERFG